MAKQQIKSIINILTNRPTLESEFAVESAISEITKLTDINEVKELAEKLTRTNHKQSNFIANALEIMCSQQEMLNFQENKEKYKKKAPLLKRIKYVLFGKD
ncbi:MAG: hypothetical protein Unbinned1007contig1000_4 [Prokaryotic dsDNA virus sp.]|nr:MAG: hypothetical protein Unbinned1007contig1000_4 [Prokaryotic dsDNA virus sp.]|tara:strand:+ start:2099 stop:2401 length:303 start_codon:yes stop_codon:yes gene_type:complete